MPDAKKRLGMAIIAFALLPALIAAAVPQAGVRLDLAFEGQPMPPRTEASAMKEVRLIWSAYGVELRPATTTHTEWDCALGLSVVLGRHRAGDALDALGSIPFLDDTPQPLIRMYPAAITALVSSATVRGLGNREWPDAFREMIAGRVLGRALAHEIGHFLLRSSRHSQTGLMRAQHSAIDLILEDRRLFELSAEELDVIAARLREGRAQLCS